MKIPPVVDWPLMVLRQHGPNALDRWHRGPRTGFGVEAVAAPTSTRIAVMRAVALIFHPVGGCDVFVRPGHLYPAVIRNRRGLGGGRRNNRIREAKLFFDIEIHLLDIRWRRIVAAIEPHNNAWMAA